jgi:hypothetical protein
LLSFFYNDIVRSTFFFYRLLDSSGCRLGDGRRRRHKRRGDRLVVGLVVAAVAEHLDGVDGSVHACRRRTGRQTDRGRTKLHWRSDGGGRRQDDASRHLDRRRYHRRSADTRQHRSSGRWRRLESTGAHTGAHAGRRRLAGARESGRPQHSGRVERRRSERRRVGSRRGLLVVAVVETVSGSELLAVGFKRVHSGLVERFGARLAF